MSMDEELLRTIIQDEIANRVPRIDDINKAIENGQKAVEKINEEFTVAKSDFLKELRLQSSAIEEKKIQLDNALASALSGHLKISENNITDTIDKFKLKSSDAIKEKSEKFDDIYNKVSSLLPLASVESIACSYKESTVRHDKDVARWNCFFILSLLIIFSIPIMVAEIAGIRIIMASAIDILNVILHSLPFEAPLIWLAIYAAKQSKKSKRLLEEYYHKYTTSMTFIGMQKNAYEQNAKYKGFSLESDNQKELNRKFISSIFENPSLTLEKQVTADLPIEELLPLIEKVGPDNVKLLLETVGKSGPQKG